MAPAIVVITIAVFVLLPLWLVAAVVASTWLPGKWRAVRMLYMALLYLVMESAMLLALFGLWLASGFGARLKTPYFQEIHYGLARVFLGTLFRQGTRVLKTEVVAEGVSEADLIGKPLLVFSRHAGPGDSFILMHALLSWYDREPRIVLKHTLAWDPMFDVLLGRIPAQFVNPNPGPGSGLEAAISRLATGLDDDDAFVIFPEGGNFTENRRTRGIERLHKLGLHKMAERAESMTYVLAPRPGGVVAALEASPNAQVVLVGHTGVDHLHTVSDLWRELPMDKRITMRWWLVDPADIPTDRESRIDWLYGWWETIDQWITENRVPEPTD
ncbi:MAG: 1-acyl-sn-glycerol-3-phosphate acyltransferase [Nocardioidaceae bacterium]|nr:MAG: 1-acyl-sn-glycerol-3-phosphate acyltransferase [Nocardioidaceae bacterium]